jgi:hypothetical protein
MDVALTTLPLMQGIETLIRSLWLLPSDAEEAEIETYATSVLKCVQIGNGVNNLEVLLSRIQTKRLQQPYSKGATRELAERAFALIGHANEPCGHQIEAASFSGPA